MDFDDDDDCGSMGWDDDDFEVPTLSAAAKLAGLEQGGGGGDVKESWDMSSEGSEDEGEKEKVIYSKVSLKKQSGKKKMREEERADASMPVVQRSYEERKADEMRAREAEMRDVEAMFGGLEGLELGADDGFDVDEADNMFADDSTPADRAPAGIAASADGPVIPRTKDDLPELLKLLNTQVEAAKAVPGYVDFARDVVRLLVAGVQYDDLDSMANMVRALANEERKISGPAAKKKKKKATGPVQKDVFDDFVEGEYSAYDDFM